MAKQGVKVDNPAQLEKVSNCIERCQKLQRLGSRVPTTRPREQLLRDILDDLKWLAHVSGRSTLGRSHTTVERKKKSIKQRRSSVTLAQIKEEGEPDGVLALSSTLPRGMAMNVNSGERVLMRSASASAGSRSVSAGHLEQQLSPPLSLLRKGIASKPGLSTISASPRRAKKRSPTLRRHPRPQTPDDDDESPMLSRRRVPKLAGMKEAQESTEYAADDEGIPDLTSTAKSLVPKSPVTSGGLPGQLKKLHLPSAPRARDETDALVIGNAAKTSPFQTKKKVVSFEHNRPGEQLVTVEIHCNDDTVDSADTRSKVKPVGPSSSRDQDLEVLKAAEFETSVTSETCLLPEGGSPKHSAHQRRKRSKSPNVLSRKKSLSHPNVRGDENRLIDTSGESSPYFAWESQPTAGGNLTRKAGSLDRRTALVGRDDRKDLYESSESDDSFI